MMSRHHDYRFQVLNKRAWLRRLRGDQIEVFKILNGYENIDSNIFFEIKESKITTGYNFMLVKKQSRLDVRKFLFSQRTINVWNKLSTFSNERTGSVTNVTRHTLQTWPNKTRQCCRCQHRHHLAGPEDCKRDTKNQRRGQAS